MLLLCSYSYVALDGDSGGRVQGEADVLIPTEAVGKVLAKVARPEQERSRQGPVTGEVIDVHDGDTLTIRIGTDRERVRLIGVEAPGLDQAPWGMEAFLALRRLVTGKSVRLETDITERDAQKRLLAYVYTREVFVNLEMIRLGHALSVAIAPNVAHLDLYEKAEDEARGAGRGIWSPKQPLNPNCLRLQQTGPEC